MFINTFIKQYINTLIALVLSIITFNSYAAIAVDSLYDVWSPEKASFVKTIYNDSNDKTAYVKLELSHVEIDAKGNKTEHLLNAKEMSQSVFMTPTRLIIPPKQSRYVRFRLPQGRSDQKAEMYKIAITPVTPEKGDGFGLSEKQLDEVKEISAGVTINIAYVSQLVVQPTSSTFNTQLFDQKDQVVIANYGNDLIKVEMQQSCKADADPKASGCTNGQKRQELRIMPNDRREIDKTHATEITFDIIENNHKSFSRTIKV